MHFSDEESLEAFVKTLPIPVPDQISILDGDEVVDATDSVDFDGMKKLIHKFKIVEKA